MPGFPMTAEVASGARMRERTFTSNGWAPLLLITSAFGYVNTSTSAFVDGERLATVPPRRTSPLGAMDRYL